MRPIDTTTALTHLSATITGIQRGLEKYNDSRILSFFERTANLLSDEEGKRSKLLNDIHQCLEGFAFRVAAELQGHPYNPPITEPKEFSASYPCELDVKYDEGQWNSSDDEYKRMTLPVNYYAKSKYPFLGLWLLDPVFSWNYLTSTDFQASLSSSSFQYDPSSSRWIMHYLLTMMQIGSLLPNTYGYQQELKNSIQGKLGSLIALFYGCEKIDTRELYPFYSQVLRDADRLYTFKRDLERTPCHDCYAVSGSLENLERRIGTSNEMEFIRWLSERPLIKEVAPGAAPVPASSPFPVLRRN